VAEGTPPDYRDQGLGARARVAAYLAECVGEGRVFTKQDLRAALPGIEQVDRRMRDLRSAGWVIRTYRDASDLKSHQLRLEAIGEPVWEAGKRSAGLRPTTAQVRREVLDRDGHRCIRCGITAGEAYPDDPGSRARLTVAPVRVGTSSASAADMATECVRCSEPVKQPGASEPTGDAVLERISALDLKDQVRLLAWMARDMRTPDAAEQAWAGYRRLPAPDRQHVQQALAEELGGPA
jgi:hypothetical protein